MTGHQDAFQQAMNRGHSAAWDQNWNDAASYYRQALEEIPGSAQALTSLGLALIELQEFDDALVCYQNAAAALPDDPLPVEKIAQLHERMGNLDQSSKASLSAAELYLSKRDAGKAIENWERVTRLNPENLAARTRLAMVYERLKNQEKAVIEYLAIASIFQSAGALDKATRSVQQALKIMPNSDEAIHALALLKDFQPLPKPERPRGGTAPIRMSQVRQLQAPSVEQEKGIDPVAAACQKALTVLAGLLFGGDDEEQDASARRGLQAIVSGTGLLRKPVDQTRMLLHLSQVVDLQTQEKYAQAADELQRAMDVGLDNPAAYYDLGYLYYQVGRLESAVRQFQHAVKSSDFALGARLMLGEMLYKKGQLRDAAVEYLEALKLADLQLFAAGQTNDLRQLYEPLIEAQRQQKEAAAQERLCDNIRELLMRPDWREQLRIARQQLPGQSGKEPPRPLAEILTEARSSYVIDSISSIHRLIELGFLRSAMEEAFFTLEQAPTYLPLHTIIGDLLSRQNNQQGAVDKFQVVARAYSTRGESQQAINLYRLILETSPTDLSYRGRLIEQLLAAGQVDEAIKEYLGLADVYISLADLNMARKTYTDALRVAQQSNVDRDQRVTILHHMADIDLQSLEWRQAVRIFEQIRTLQPTDEKAWHNLIELNFRFGQEQQALTELDNYLTYLGANQMGVAQEFLQTLVEENPHRIPVRRRLADLYRHWGQTTEAIEQLDAIGELLLEAGDTGGAIQTIETIMAMKPPNTDDYLKLLEQLRGQ